MVLLHLQAAGVRRHRVLRAAEEERTDHVPARVPPLDDVPAVVDWHAMGGRRLGYVSRFACSPVPIADLVPGN